MGRFVACRKASAYVERQVCSGDFATTVAGSNSGMTFGWPGMPDDVRIVIRIEAVKEYPCAKGPGQTMIDDGCAKNSHNDGQRPVEPHRKNEGEQLGLFADLGHCDSPGRDEK